MPAINFQPWKADKVTTGASVQTIRRQVRSIRRGARLTFYVGQRTKMCRKLGEGVCLGTEPVILGEYTAWTKTLGWLRPLQRDALARQDGFGNYTLMWNFFYDRYCLSIEQDPDGVFRGHRIWWRLDEAFKKYLLKRLKATRAPKVSGKLPKRRAARPRTPDAKARRPRRPASR